MKRILKKKEFYSCILILFFIDFLTFIFAPFEIYLSNKNSFFFDGYELILTQMLMFSCTFILGAILCIIICSFSEDFLFNLVILTFSIFISFYIQGNFLSFSYGTLNGHPIEWSNYKYEGIISLITFLVPLLIGITICIFVKNKKLLLKYTGIISVCIVLVQAITIATLLLTNHGLSKENLNVSTTEYECSLSKEQNFIVIILDTFDSKLFQNMISGENSDKYSAMMSDFTYYPNTVCAYSATELALPQIITGKYFDNNVTFGNYLNDSYTKSSFISRMIEDDWNINIYAEGSMPSGNICKSLSNVKNTKLTVNSHRRLTQYMYLLVGFRYLPQQLKQLCWFYPDDIGTTKSLNNGEWESFTWSNQSFYLKTDDMDTNQKKKTFQFYHLEGTHEPYTTHEDLLTIDSEDVGIETESIGVWLMVEKYLNKLKENDIYDNSTIIIMGDHGHYGLRQNPIFMIKGINEHHDLKTLNTPVSYVDLQDIYCQLLDKQTGDNVMNIPENSSRERSFLEYDFRGTLTENSYSSTIYEYKSDGLASDTESFQLSGHMYAPKQ